MQLQINEEFAAVNVELSFTYVFGLIFIKFYTISIIWYGVYSSFLGLELWVILEFTIFCLK